MDVKPVETEAMNWDVPKTKTVRRPSGIALMCVMAMCPQEFRRIVQCPTVIVAALVSAPSMNVRPHRG